MLWQVSVFPLTRDGVFTAVYFQHVLQFLKSLTTLLKISRKYGPCFAGFFCHLMVGSVYSFMKHAPAVIHCCSLHYFVKQGPNYQTKLCLTSVQNIPKLYKFFCKNITLSMYLFFSIILLKCLKVVHK